MEDEQHAGDAWTGETADPQFLSAVIETQNDLAAIELEPGAVMRLAAERAQKLTGADGAVIDLIDGEETIHTAGSGKGASCVGLRLKIGASLAGLAIRQRKILHSEDTQTDPRVDWDACRRSGVRSMVITPLMHENQVLGLLRVLSLRPQAFRPEHAAVLRLMAGAISGALRRANELSDKERLLSERGNALSALSQSEHRFRLAFEHAPNGMALIALDGQLTQVNQSLCEMLGYSDAELLALKIQNLTHPEDRGADQERFQQLIVGGARRHHVNKRLFHKSRRIVWAEVTSSLLRGGEGQPLYYICHIQDVTEGIQAEWLEEDRSAVLEMVAQDQPLQAALERLTRMVERQAEDVVASVLVLDEGTILQISPHVPEAVQEAVQQRPVSFAASLCAYDEGSEPPLRTSRITRDDQIWGPIGGALLQSQLNGCWSVPIRTPDRTFLALLLAYTRECRQPSPGEERCLQQAAKLGTVAIEHFQITRQLAHLARHDLLTGLPNRLLLEDRLQQAIALGRRNGNLVALLALDLDFFKTINDTRGHQAGDELLQQFARRVRGTIRESDTVARLGGDEFLIILPELHAKDEAALVAKKLIAVLSQPYLLESGTVQVSASIGIAVYPTDAQESMALQKAADAALYEVKGRGRNGFQLAPPSDRQGD